MGIEKVGLWRVNNHA